MSSNDRSAWSSLFRYLALVVTTGTTLCSLHIRPASATDPTFSAAHFWMPSSTLVLRDVALSANGTHVVGGVFTGPTLTLGNLTVAQQGNVAGFVAKQTPEGVTEWIYPIHGPGAGAAVYGIAVGPDGSVVAVGQFGGSSLSQPSLSYGNDSQGFVIKLTADGELLWARSYPSDQAAWHFFDVAVGPDGNVVAVGDVQRAAVPPLNQSMLGLQDALAVAFTPNGDVSWATTFGGVGALARSQSVSIGPTGRVFVGTDYSRAALARPIAPAPRAPGAFIVELSATGEVVWSTLLASTSDPSQFIYVRELAASPTGRWLLPLRSKAHHSATGSLDFLHLAMRTP